MNNALDNEVNLISSPAIRNYVLECIRRTPEYFWAVPSSSSGKYHPQDENTKGGTVLHTRRAVRIAEDLCRMYNVIGEDRDCVIAATIMHDFCKNGYPRDMRYTVSGHGSLWINIGQTKENYKGFKDSKMAMTIGRLIACHMGRFDIPFLAGATILDTIVQTADYISSREYISVNV